MKERCRCGNRVPIGELKGGLCIPCVREAKEKQQAAQEAAEFQERKERYLSQHPFYAYLPRSDE